MAGEITSDGGALLLAKTNKAIRLIERVAPAFTDRRNPALIEHSVATLVGQRIMGEALGYPDINDHDLLRHDPLLAAVMGKLTARDKRCAPLAGKSTLNRLEHSPQEGEGRAPDRYHKISHDGAAIDRLFLDVFREAYTAPPKIVVLDPDATDVALHGNQEGRHYHGFYDSYCYLPLYIFCGRHLLAARLRPASVDAASGIVEEIARIVAFIREHWPQTTIVVRADSGFCRDNLMTWCEDNDVHFVLGCAKTAPLIAQIEPELAEAETEHKATCRTALQVVRLDDAQELDAEAPRGGEGRVDGRRGQPALHRDVDARGRDRRALSLRGCLLQARRDGEPDQGDAVGSVRRPHAGDDDAGQPASHVLLSTRLRADVRVVLEARLRHDVGSRSPARTWSARRAARFVSGC